MDAKTLETLGKLAGILIRVLQENRSNEEPKAPRYSEAPRPTAAAGAGSHPGPKVDPNALLALATQHARNMTIITTRSW
jgi:hypothetical protein